MQHHASSYRCAAYETQMRNEKYFCSKKKVSMRWDTEPSSTGQIYTPFWGSLLNDPWKKFGHDPSLYWDWSIHIYIWLLSE